VASRATLSIRVTSTRGASTVQYSTKGKYVSLITAGYNRLLRKQPLFTSTNANDFWLAVLGVVTADQTDNPSPP
jgi:hypothetical protein